MTLNPCLNLSLVYPTKFYLLISSIMSISIFSELRCSEFRSSGWPNSRRMTCEGYVGRKPSICPCHHPLSQYRVTCGRWQGRPVAFRVTADDLQFCFFLIFWSVFGVKDWMKALIYIFFLFKSFKIVINELT